VKRRTWLTAAALVAIVALALVTRASWLPLPAAWLRVDEPIRPADVMMVLSGQSLVRVRKAADLFQQHYAPRILVSGGDEVEYFELLTGERAYDAELAARVLVRLGVPRSALVLINGMKSTHDEASALGAYVAAHHIRSVLLVTSHLHSRRARWTFRRALAGAGTDVSVVEADQSDVNVRDWWRHPDAALGVLNEYLKFGYYLVHY
jgi:uncharacterized SAM-binding protein YcdF (DUF218 family)